MYNHPGIQRFSSHILIVILYFTVGVVQFQILFVDGVDG